MSRARGPYTGWDEWRGSGFGVFLKHLRRARNMTQKQYAEFLGCSLRTLVTEEKRTTDFLPWAGGAVGHPLVTKEFTSKGAMETAYAAFKAERRK